MNLKWYLIIISIISAITTALISYFYSESILFVGLAMILGVIIAIIIDGLTAAVFRLLPIGFADFNKKFYIVSKKEYKIYNKLKIKAWKDKIPEIGHFTGFRKNKVDEPKNPEYIKRFLHEICYGETGHLGCMLTGFLVIFIPWFKPYWICIALVVGIVNAFLNMLPVFVLRYNSYSLLTIYKRLTRLNK